MFLQKIEKQEDGRWSFYYTDENGKTQILKDAAECCNFNIVDSKQSIYLEVYFEVVKK